MQKLSQAVAQQNAAISALRKEIASGGGALARDPDVAGVAAEERKTWQQLEGFLGQQKYEQAFTLALSQQVSAPSLSQPQHTRPAIFLNTYNKKTHLPKPLLLATHNSSHVVHPSLPFLLSPVYSVSET